VKNISRRAARAERLSDERHEIQRQALFDLQKELVNLAAFTSRIIMFDRRNPGGRIVDGKVVRLPDELNEAFTESVRIVQRLVSVVLDSELREAVDAFKAQCTNATMIDPNQSSEQLVALADARIQDMARAFPPVNALLGNRIREEINRLGAGDPAIAIPPQVRRRRWHRR
jgi:hypothetical protein